MIATGEPKRARLALRVTEELRADLEALARKDNRSLAGYAEIVLREHVEGKKSGKSTGKRKS
jgi:hypothetical protein